MKTLNNVLVEEQTIGWLDQLQLQTQFQTTRTRKPPRVDKTPSQALLDGARYIEEHGWTQHMVTDPYTGSVCAVGALIYTGGDRPAAIAALTDYIHARAERDRSWYQKLRGYHAQYRSLPAWNDMNGRTKEEVISTFREAAREVVGK